MELFFRLYPNVIPIYLWALVIGTSTVGTVVALGSSWIENKRNWTAFIWMIGYLLLLLYATVLCREASNEYRYELTPFWSIEAIGDGFVETFYEKLYNVILFIPFGIIASLYPLKECRFCKVLALGCSASVCIELLQLVTKTGTCETDDVICNTVGCAIGAGVVWIGKELVGMVKN